MKRLIFAVLLFVSGCSSTDYILQEEIRTDLSRGDTQKALQTAKSDYYYVDDASEITKESAEITVKAVETDKRQKEKDKIENDVRDHLPARSS